MSSALGRGRPATENYGATPRSSIWFSAPTTGPRSAGPKALARVKPIAGNFLQQLIYPFSGPVHMLVERKRRGLLLACLPLAADRAIRARWLNTAPTTS